MGPSTKQFELPPYPFELLHQEVCILWGSDPHIPLLKDFNPLFPKYFPKITLGSKNDKIGKNVILLSKIARKGHYIEMAAFTVVEVILNSSKMLICLSLQSVDFPWFLSYIEDM